MPKVSRISVDSNYEEVRVSPGPEHPDKKSKKKKWKIVVGCILGAFLLTVAVLIVVNLSVLKLVLSPEKIVIPEREESISVLKQLESAGDVRNLEVSSDTGEVSFFNADESIKIASKYDGERVTNISGEIDTGRVSVSTIDEGKELARVMLSPYLSDEEITAILVRYSADIISGISSAASDNINMSFDIGNNYQVTVTGSAYDTIEFNIVATQ